VRGCGGRERLATSSLNWVCNFYYVESENICCHISCYKSIVFDITSSSSICVVVRARHVTYYVRMYSCSAFVACLLMSCDSVRLLTVLFSYACGVRVS